MKEKYTADQIEFLRVAYIGLHVDALTALFNRVYGTHRTEAAIRSLLRKHGITCDLAYKRSLFGAKNRIFTPEQIEFIGGHYAGRSLADLTDLFNRRFKTRMTRRQIRSAVHNRGIVSGRTGRFEKSFRPHNKGIKGWQAGGRSAETRFKPGRRPHTWVPVGSERVVKGGILQRKISDTGYPPRDWKSVHGLLWEEHHGPIPKGHLVIFRNGDINDIRIENLELVSRPENMRRNSIQRLPEALKDVCRTLGVLNRRINKRSGGYEKQD